MAPQVSMVPIFSFVSDPTQFVLDEEHVKRLAEDFTERQRVSPEECPVTTPLLVYVDGGRYHIIAGNHRFAGALRAMLKELPCIIVPKPKDEAERRAAIFKDNALRRIPSRLETASAVLNQQSLRNCSQGAAARALGISESDATKAIAVLNKFPADLHPLIGDGDGRIPFSSAYALTALSDEPKVRELADRIVKGLLTRDRLGEVLKPLLGKKPGKEKPVKITLPGFTLVISLFDAEKLAGVLALLDGAMKKREKHGLPWSSLPQLVRS